MNKTIALICLFPMGMLIIGGVSALEIHLYTKGDNVICLLMCLAVLFIALPIFRLIRRIFRNRLEVGTAEFILTALLPSVIAAFVLICILGSESSMLDTATSYLCCAAFFTVFVSLPLKETKNDFPFSSDE